MKTLIAASVFAVAFAACGAAAPFKLTSPDFKEGGMLAEKTSCSGENVSPALDWTNPPAGTKSFALMVQDPDPAPGWWHWVVYNIPADIKSLPAGAGKPDNSAMPTGAVQGNSDFETPGYGGPCPPAGSGNHRYVFTLFALKDEKLELPKTATPVVVRNLMGNALGSTKLTANYSKK